jgi:enoyl reductase-like protein
MRQGQYKLSRRPAKALHGHVDDITYEPLPRRWVELIHFLDEQGQKRAQRPQVEKALHGKRWC